MPGHRPLGPQGTGLLAVAGTRSRSCRGEPEACPSSRTCRIFCRTGEAGTVNVPGICGLAAGMTHIRHVGLKAIAAREEREAMRAAQGLAGLGLRVFTGPHQAGVLSFLPPDGDCETAAERFAAWGCPAGWSPLCAYGP